MKINLTTQQLAAISTVIYLQIPYYAKAVKVLTQDQFKHTALLLPFFQMLNREYKLIKQNVTFGIPNLI